MPRRRLIASVLLSMSALTAALAVPAAAAADPPNISITSAGATGGNPAMLTVVADDGNGLTITSLVAHLNTGGSALDPPITMSAGSSADPASQAFTATIPQGEFPAGTYTITVDAADSTETDNGLAAPGSLAFVYATTLTASSTTISYSHQSATISGKLTGIPPGAGAAGPASLAGVPVYLVKGSGPAQLLATTKTGGSYQATVTPDPASSYTVQTKPSATMAAAQAPARIKVTRDATRLRSLRVTPSRLRYGQTGTLTGTVQYKNGASWTSLAGATVQVSVGGTKLAAAHAGAGGAFSAPLPTADGRTWSAVTGGSAFLGTATASGSLQVSVPLAFRWFRAALTPFGDLDASGCVQVTVPHYTAPSGVRIEVQYAQHPGGPWKYLSKARLKVAGKSSCAAQSQSSFSVSVSARLSNAYYRAVFTRDASFGPAVSKVAHAWKYVTEITALRVSPRSVRRGGKVTVHGRLMRFNRSWRPFGNQQILIIIKPRGSKSWFWIAKVNANASGYFGKTVTDPKSADWSAEYTGNGAYLASAGKQFYVSVR